MEPAEELVLSFLERVREITLSRAGTAETSHYTAVETLLRGIGARLRPAVVPVAQITRGAAGQPDFGLFTSEQLSRQVGAGDRASRGEVLPDRGIVEVKGPADSLTELVDTRQVATYKARYGLVLVTNLRQWATVVTRPGKPPQPEDVCTIAADPEAFRALLRSKRFAAHAMPLVEFLSRALMRDVELERPADVAWVLASYARELKSRLVAHSDVPAVVEIRNALEAGLGQKFTGERGDFFPSALAQTLVYGLFASWLRHTDSRSTDPFTWKAAAHSLPLPVVRAIFHKLTEPDVARATEAERILTQVAATLERVVEEAFLAEFQGGAHAIQHFYEPFLEHFDPDLRRAMGVWYTPSEVVDFIVDRVDLAIKSRLGRPLGLADPGVFVLDPATGTGSFLIAVLRRLHKTLVTSPGDVEGAQAYLSAVRGRIRGFEILPAPYVVAHLQAHTLLAIEQKLPLPPDEQLGIFLTNALTGWTDEASQPLPIPALAAERDRAQHVKRDEPILVVLGNPPYGAFAGVAPAQEGGLIDAYKEGLNVSESAGGWGIKKFNLDDLFVRFWRVAERRIAEQGAREGVVCFISPRAWIDDAQFVVMRERYFKSALSIDVDDLHGDSRETGKTTPDGKPDPSVFSTRYNTAGITVGTAVVLVTWKGQAAPEGAEVRYREWWGKDKRAALRDAALSDDRYGALFPTRADRYRFVPSVVAAAYRRWPRLTDIAASVPVNGLLEKRGGALVEIDRARLETRIRAWGGAEAWENAKEVGQGLAQAWARFDPRKAWQRHREGGGFQADHLVRYQVRPLDSQWCYWSEIRPLWNEPRPDFWHALHDAGVVGRQRFLFSRFQPRGDAGVPIAWWGTGLVDDHFFDPDVRAFPILRPGSAGPLLPGPPTANLAAAPAAWLRALGIDPENEPEVIWLHSLAICSSPSFCSRHADGLSQDFPRIPLPGFRPVPAGEAVGPAFDTLRADGARSAACRDALCASVALGKVLANLMDDSKGVPGVTERPLLPGLASVGQVRLIDGSASLTDEHRTVSADWGSRGRVGRNEAIMPGDGRIVVRARGGNEADDLAAGAQRVGCSVEEAGRRIGGQVVDVYLNDKLFIANVPQAVWELEVGGYRVLKKWLSYRVKSGGDVEILGRPLTVEELMGFGGSVRRLTALLLLGPALDANAEAIEALAQE